jgi:hypothetical protein
MTEADPDAIGPDGRVRLRCYLPSPNSVWRALIYRRGAAVKLALGIVLGLAFALLATVALTPSLQNGTRWFLLLLGWLLLVACVLSCCLSLEVR